MVLYVLLKAVGCADKHITMTDPIGGRCGFTIHGIYIFEPVGITFEIHVNFTNCANWFRALVQ